MRLILATLGIGLALAPAAASAQGVFEGPVARASCGPGSQPESPGSLQGEVTAADRNTGRSLKPFTCNLTLVGNEPGPGTSWQHTWYEHCAYYDTKGGSNLGVQVLDVSDTAKPRTTTTLTSTAMQDPWESLSVNQPRGLLAGVYQGNGGPLFFDVYDVKKDCAKPELLSSSPVNTVGHEGDWAPDGKTYYGSGGAAVTAIDVTDPAAPRTVGAIPVSTHGLSISDDGNRAYLATIASPLGGGSNGLTIVDTSQIQARMPAPVPRVIGSVTWADGAFAQHTVPITIKGHPYLLFVDEGGLTTVPGAARIIDIADEAHPKVVSKLKLEIHMPDQQAKRDETADSGFGYDAHYCGVDRRVDPTIVVCSMFESGERVFDVRDIMHPREIAYYNPGGTGEGPKPGTQDTRNPSTSGYPSARPRIIPDRSEIWFTDQNKGFNVVRFTNGVWPFSSAGDPVPAALGLPSHKTCLRGAAVKIRVKQPKRRRLRSAVVYVNGRAVKRVRGRALRRPVSVRLPKGHSVLRIVGRARSGKRYSQTRDFTRCG